MKLLTHDDTVKIVMSNNGEILNDRHDILEDNKEKVVITISLTSPSESGMNTFGDSVIMSQEDKTELNVQMYGTYDIMLGCLYKDCVLPEAIRLSAKESLSHLLKEKVKPDIIYVMYPGFMTRKEFINMILIFQNIIQELKIKATLLVENIAYQGINIETLSMDYEDMDNEEEPKKEKKKKKKDKKKGKY